MHIFSTSMMNIVNGRFECKYGFDFSIIFLFFTFYINKNSTIDNNKKSSDYFILLLTDILILHELMTFQLSFINFFTVSPVLSKKGTDEKNFLIKLIFCLSLR